MNRRARAPGMCKFSALCFHGGYSSGSAWGLFGQFLSEAGWRVSAPTLPLHERTLAEPPHPDLVNMTLQDMCDAGLRHAMEAERPLVLFGHSYGAYQALHVGAALTRLGRPPHAVISIAGSGPPGVSVWRKLNAMRLSWRNMMAKDAERRAWKPELADMRKLLLNEHRDPSDEIIAAKVLENVRWESPTAMNDWSRNPGRAYSIAKDDIDAPMLFVAGERDVVIPASYVNAIARHFGARASFATHPGDHWLIEGVHTRALVNYCVDWVENLEGKQAA